MIDWFCDELPYWLLKLEYYIVMLIVIIVKYSILFAIKVYEVISAAIKLLLKDN